MVRRCEWASEGDPEIRAYHDREWGVPTHDDRRHFEFLTLEGAQAGLSWSTILRKRDGYRYAFSQFDPAKVAGLDARAQARLAGDARIVRNRAKIASTIANARAFLAVQKEFGSFDAYAWPFVGGSPRQNRWKRLQELPAQTGEAESLSDDLRKRGFRFVGPTIVYSYMQAVGLVNDHQVDCFRYRPVQKLGQRSTSR